MRLIYALGGMAVTVAVAFVSGQLYDNMTGRCPYDWPGYPTEHERSLALWGLYPVESHFPDGVWAACDHFNLDRGSSCVAISPKRGRQFKLPPFGDCVDPAPIHDSNGELDIQVTCEMLSTGKVVVHRAVYLKKK